MGAEMGERMRNLEGNFASPESPTPPRQSVPPTAASSRLRKSIFQLVFRLEPFLLEVRYCFRLLGTFLNKYPKLANQVFKGSKIRHIFIWLSLAPVLRVTGVEGQDDVPKKMLGLGGIRESQFLPSERIPTLAVFSISFQVRYPLLPWLS